MRSLSIGAVVQILLSRLTWDRRKHKTFCLLLVLTTAGLSCARAVAVPDLKDNRIPLAEVPPEIASDHFVVTTDGHQTEVMHAALSLYFLNFDAHKGMKISVMAATDDYWAKGVEVQPWRLGIRPRRDGRTISFTLDGPAQITISRPGDYQTQAEMLYLFANPRRKSAPTAVTAGVRYIAPGAHTENIDAKTGDKIYLAAGAIVFGSLNVWQVDHVKVFGPGVIVYDGPQNPANDDGWMHRRNWHCIVMDEAHDISIADITCVVRSRTWQIQMKDSRHILFDNVKVIGANAGNANADGMDWLGGGDTVVRNSFFRAADDVFAFYTSWEGYGPEAFAVQGKPVTNVSIENVEVSTSISNIVRIGWPEKNFEGGNIFMKNADILHMGMGGCGVPFALVELWAYPQGRGQSAEYSFEDIRMEDWYSLFNIEQPTPVRDIHFTDIFGLAQPSLVSSVLKGDVARVTLDNVDLAGRRVNSAADVPVTITNGAAPVTVTNTGPQVQVKRSSGWLRPRQNVSFEAVPSGSTDDLHYSWIFGDGTTSSGRKVKHRFADANGTLLDGSGLYRVILHASSDTGRNTWVSVPTVVRDSANPALSAGAGEPGITYRVEPIVTAGASLDTASVRSATATASSGTAASFALVGIEHPAQDYALALTSDINVPEDGGYQFMVISNDASSITVDGQRLGTAPVPFRQVCGLAGYAARPVTVVTELAKGLHNLEIRETHTTGADNFQVLWQRPGSAWEPIPEDRLSHR